MAAHGGRNALVEAIRYPEDYDGIIRWRSSHGPQGTQIWGYKNAKAFTSFIPPAALPAIDAAVKANCDRTDGVVDDSSEPGHVFI